MTDDEREVIIRRCVESQLLKGKKLTYGSYGYENLVCPMTRVALEHGLPRRSPELALQIDFGWKRAFTEGFDGVTDTYRHESAYKLGVKLRKEYEDWGLL